MMVSQSLNLRHIGMLAVAFCVTATSVHAADYWVSNSGSDSAAGSQSAPFATLAHAAALVAPGDVVHVLNGTYTGFQVTTSGSALAPIEFRGEGTSVLVNQRNSSTPDNINLEGASYVTIDGFVVEDAPRIGIRSVQGTGVVIRGNTVRRSGLTGILSGWTPSIRIENNVCSGSGTQHGIYVSNSNTPNDNPVIRNNESFGNGENGIQINGDCWTGGDGVITGALVEGNIVHDNNWKGLSLISMQSSVVENNVIYNNGITAGAGGIHLTDQVGASCNLPSSNNVVANNTIVEPRIACIRMTDGSVGNDIFNNVCIGHANSYLIVDEVGGNLIDTASNLTGTSSAGLFVNESTGDYHPASSSAIVDRGIATYQGQNAPTVDRDGTARGGPPIDAGAYELTAGGATDLVAPTIALLSPSDNLTLSGSVLASANASDNVGVVAVRFEIDGALVGSEDTAAPWEATFVAENYSAGSHTLSATARDAAGNVSAPATIGFSVAAQQPGGILPNHPRLYNVNARIPALRQAACLDANGNPIPNCTPTAEYTDFYAHNIGDGRGDAWTFALMYKLTGNLTYATTAISDVMGNIADGLGSKGSGERQDYFLNGHHYTRNAAVVFDWLYDVLTPSQRSAIMNYMNQIVYESTNPRTNPCKTSSGWSQNNPKDNYYYRHVLSAALLAMATYGENSGSVTFQDCTGSGAGPGGTHPLILTYNGVDYTDPLTFVYAKLDDQAIPYITGRESGGGWREGTNYGRASKILMFEIFQVLRDGGGRNFFNEIDFPRQALRFQLHEFQPDNLYHYTNGDAPRDPLERRNDSDTHQMRLLVDGLDGRVEADYAQFWLNTFAGLPSDRKKKAFNFFLARPNHAERDYRLDLPTNYYAPGMGYVNSRSDWTPNAVSVNFVSTARIANHTHKNQNEFAIFRSGWQTVSGNTYSRSGLHQQTIIHNTIVVNHDGQRYGEGTGDIVKFEATGEYTYAVGDASDAYYSNASGWGSGQDKMTDIYLRELVHLQPDVVVVFDRVTPTSQYASTDVTYLLNSRNKATISGNLTTLANGSGKLFQKTMLPTNATFSNVQSSDGTATWWREEVDSAPAPHHEFLNVLYAGPATASSMPAVSMVSESAGKMVGVQVSMSGEDRVVMFSTDPAGTSPVGDVMFNVGALEPSVNLLYDLVPGAGYDVVARRTGSSYRVRVMHGSSLIASAAGVLRFRLDRVPAEVATVTTGR